MTFAQLYAVQFAWGLVILAAFVGWGTLIRRMVSATGETETDWGLLAGWGLAAVILLGGVMNVLRLATPGPVVGVILIGAAAGAWHFWRNRVRWPAWSALGVGLAIIVLVPILSRYAAAVSYEALSCSDDNIAYFPFIVRMLETGALHDPFSLRRLAGHGGQSFLQALSVALGNEKNAYLVDRGVAMIVCFGLVAGYLRSMGAKDALSWVIPLLLVVLLPFPMLNSASHVTGLALFLTLFRTLESAVHSQGHSGIMVTGLVIAGAAALRAHFVFAAAVTVLIYFALAARESGGWRKSLGGLVQTGAAGIIAFAPWMIVLWQSSRTPLYPLFAGTHRPDYDNYTAPLDLAGQIDFLGSILISPGIALFAAPIVLYAFRRPSSAGLALYMASLLTVAVLAWSFTTSDAENIHRYAAPFLNAAFIATTAVFVCQVRTALPPASPESSRRVGDALLAVAVLILLPIMVNKDIARLSDHWGRTGLPANVLAAYAAAQNAVPPGAGLFAVVSHPFALDYGRNRIAGVDVPGAASPDPGMPFFQGPSALKTYLKDQGLTHVIFRDFDRRGGCLYDRRLWRHNTTADYPEGRFQAKYYLDLMDNLDALAVSERRLATSAGLTVLALR